MIQNIKNIGWIGTGVMGLSMCKHLLKAGYNLKVYNRTKAKAQELIDQGVQFVSPKEIAETSDAVFLMLGYPKDVEEIALGENGVLNFMKPGTFLIDHTTSSPQLAERIYAEALKKNVASIDAPVSGGDIGAREGRLVVMCGGDLSALEPVRSVIQTYSARIELLGKAGKGQHAKMANQILLAGNMIGTVEALIYGKKAGLDLNQLIETLKSGQETKIYIFFLSAANSVAWSVLGQRMVNNDFKPGFYVEHYIKDMEIALEEAKRANLCLPGLALVKQFYHALCAHGGARMGTQALILAIEKMNNFELEKRN